MLAGAIPVFGLTRGGGEMDEIVGEGLGAAGGSVAALTLTVAFVFTFTPGLPPAQAAAPALPPSLVGGNCCPLAEEADIASHPTAVVADLCCCGVVACFFSAFEDEGATRTRLAGDSRWAGSAVVAAEVVLQAVATVAVALANVVSAHAVASSSALTPLGPLFWRWQGVCARKCGSLGGRERGGCV